MCQEKTRSLVRFSQKLPCNIEGQIRGRPNRPPPIRWIAQKFIIITVKSFIGLCKGQMLNILAKFAEGYRGRAENKKEVN